MTPSSFHSRNLLMRMAALAVLVASAGPLWATDHARPFSFQVVAVRKNAAMPSLAYLNRQQESMKLKIPEHNLSTIAETRLTEHGQLLLFSPKTVGQPDRKPLMSLSIPASVNHAILLLLPNRGNPDQPYEVQLIPDLPGRFPDGAKMFVNLTKLPISSRLQGNTTFIPPGDAKAVQAKSHRQQRLNIEVEVKHGAHWSRIASSRWTFDPAMRSLVLVYRERVSGAYRLKSIRLPSGQPGLEQASTTNRNP